MLKIDREIEDDHSDEHSDPKRQQHDIEQSPAVLSAAECGAEGSRREKNPQQNGIDG
jgi:hypothetical protein